MPIMLRVKLSPSRLRTIRPSRSACASGPPARLGASASQASSARLVEPVGSSIHLLRQIKTPHEAAFLSGGGGSLQRTRLQPKFRANREKYREFHTFLR